MRLVGSLSVLATGNRRLDSTCSPRCARWQRIARRRAVGELSTAEDSLSGGRGKYGKSQRGPEYSSFSTSRPDVQCPPVQQRGPLRRRLHHCHHWRQLPLHPAFLSRVAALPACTVVAGTCHQHLRAPLGTRTGTNPLFHSNLQNFIVLFAPLMMSCTKYSPSRPYGPKCTSLIILSLGPWNCTHRQTRLTDATQTQLASVVVSENTSSYPASLITHRPRSQDSGLRPLSSLGFPNGP